MDGRVEIQDLLPGFFLNPAIRTAGGGRYIRRFSFSLLSVPQYLLYFLFALSTFTAGPWVPYPTCHSTPQHPQFAISFKMNLLLEARYPCCACNKATQEIRNG